MKYVAVITTCRSKEEAVRIANHLVNEKLVACANWWPVGSTYWWEGQCEQAEEYMLFLKTMETKLKPVESAIKAVHSYENPEVIHVPITGGSAEYLDWVKESVL
ncbi:MAG: divalent-cation tolerance protein CutA [bacterium]